MNTANLDLDLNLDELDIGNFDSSTKTGQPSIVNTQKSVQESIPTSNGTVISNNLVANAQKKLKAIELELNNIFVERDVIIKNALRALIIGQSILLLGPPGTGKSALTNELCGRITGGLFFSWLLNKTSDPSEILGPYSVKGMENDKFKRITAGKLPEAHIAFLDEIFKCNAPTLNILLPLINEKIIFNDGKAVPVPLISLFAASNELPEDESLDALYDRLIFRMYVGYVKDPANKQKMYEGYLSKRIGISNNARTTISLQELQAMQNESKSVKISKDVLKTFIKLINSLNKDGITVSDRRQNECLKILQGSALFEGRTNVTLDDLKALVYVLWENEEDIPDIESRIMKLVNPYDDKVNDLKKKFEEIKNRISTADKNDKSKISIEAKTSIETIVNMLNKLIKQASKDGKSVDEFIKLRNNMVVFNQNLIQEAIGIDILNDDGDSIF